MRGSPTGTSRSALSGPACVKIDDIAPYSATVGIGEVRQFGQIDVPDFTGPLHSRIESYGHPEAVHPRNLYEAQRAIG